MQHVDLRAAKARQLTFLAEAEQAQHLRQNQGHREFDRFRLRQRLADLLVRLAERLRKRDETVGRAVGRGQALG